MPTKLKWETSRGEVTEVVNDPEMAGVADEEPFAGVPIINPPFEVEQVGFENNDPIPDPEVGGISEQSWQVEQGGHQP